MIASWSVGWGGEDAGMRKRYDNAVPLYGK